MSSSQQPSSQQGPDDGVEVSASFDPVIAIADHNEVRKELYERWLPHAETVTVDSLSELGNILDPRVGIVVLSVDFSDRDTAEVISALRQDNLCRWVVVTVDDPIDGIFDTSPDEVLVRPLDEDALRSTIDTLRPRAAYGRLLGVYYSLATEASAVGTGDGPSDAATEQQLHKRLGRIKAELDHLTAQLSDDDRQEILDRISPSNDPVGADSPDSGQCRCSDDTPAEAEWEQIASDVWKCVQCGRTRRENRPGNPDVAKRYIK